MSKKSPKKSTAVAVKDKKQEELKKLVNMFAGSSSLVQNGNKNERELILKVARVFAIPATCINIMGGLPYINKDGLLFKLNEYEGDQILSLETKMVQYSTHTGERAIAEAVLELKDGRKFNAIGEADENSVKLVAVKMTPNMMAETRAQNRVIRKAIAARILNDLYTKLGENSGYSEQERTEIEGAITSSAEEMTNKEALEKARAIDITPKTPAQENVIKKAEAVNLIFSKIAEEKDINKLSAMREKVESWTVLSENEKKMLQGAIDNKLQQYAKENI